MSLRFIIGRAGTGKTWKCLSEIAARLQEEQTNSLIYLVPEQATFHTEKKLLSYCPHGGTMRAQVLSFQRLAWMVLQETGGGIYPPLNEVGKTLILRSIIERHKQDFLTFKRGLNKPGFLENIVQCIAEFKAYNISPHQLEEALQQLPEEGQANLRDKLQDLYLFYQKYEEYIEKQYLDNDDYLHLLAKKLEKTRFLNDAEIWIDGFHSFSPQEYMVLKALLDKVKCVNITLCLGEEHLKKRLGELDTFYQTWETYQVLLKLAQERGCPLAEKEILGNSGPQRFSEQPELKYLEEYFAGNSKVSWQDKNSAVKLVAAGNRLAELEGVARGIINLCREKGFHYRDIALLLRDYSLYEDLLPAVFANHQIPYFIDQKRPLYHHPLLDLIRGALEVVDKGWTYEAIFRYLKTDLTSLSRQEVDLLENYCLAHGIRGTSWTNGKPWIYRRSFTLGEEDNNWLTKAEEVQLKRINKARSKAVQELQELVEELKEAVEARQFASFIFKLLEDLAVARKLEFWSRQAEKSGRLEDAKIHSQVWQKVVELLDQLVEVMGDQEVTLPEFIQILNSGLESIELGLIPPGLDQVLIGSLDRSRNPDLKAVFILGVNEGVLPARTLEEGLLSDEERKILADLHIELGPTSVRKLFNEQFLIYLAVTRASQNLWLSYPLADEEGKALSPSILMEKLKQLFTTAEDNSPVVFYPLDGEGDKEEDIIVHPRPVLGYLALRLSQAKKGKDIHPIWWKIYNLYLGQEEWQLPLKRIVTALFFQQKEQRLTPSQAKRLYGHVLRTSVSRLEKYKACPFSYFLNYGLKLKERQEFRLKAPDLGQFYHAALEGIYKELQENNLNQTDLSLEELKALVEKVVDSLIPQLQNEILLSTARYRHLAQKLKRIVFRTVKVLREHEKRGTFRPLGVEIAFGKGEKLPGLALTLQDGTNLILQGRIDRLDGALGKEGYYLRVIDYKSGRPSLSLLEIYYGLKLQLLVYLDVVLKHAPHLIQREVRPGGIFYFKIQEPFLSEKGPMEQEELESKLLREFKMQGYALKDAQVIQMMDQNIKGHSELIPAALKNDGEFYKNNDNLLSLEEFGGLCSHVERILQEIGEEIIAGNVGIKPYKFKGKNPCKFCPYKAVCWFDVTIPGYEYVNLAERDTGEIWYNIGLERGKEDE